MRSPLTVVYVDGLVGFHEDSSLELVPFGARYLAVNAALVDNYNTYVVK